ncbi:type VI secretion system tip protein TssI/VgrG [Sorangium sp. So ce1014]|uniref:type VI secretion system Vgr family protein n=1 Tax=Sorangium sp. So ce1014 TaxID=3133326 RepID=UPI003F60844B
MAIDVRLTFPTSGVTGFEVHQLDYRDALNELFELTLDVVTTDPEVDLSSVVGEEIVVELDGEPFLKKVHGIVRRVRQLSAEPTGVSRYELAVVPPLWLSTRAADHRIIQNLTADDVCEVVASAYGGRIPAPSSLIASPDRPAREYRVQYGETDFDFMFRALADEGLISYFDHGSGSSDWVLAEDTAFTDDGAPRVPFVPPAGAGMSAAAPTVSFIAITSSIETSMVTVRDYDFKKPEYVLDQRAETSQRAFVREATLERYEFTTNRFTAASEKHGEALAKRYLEEARSERRVFECHTSFALGAGGRFTVEEHPRADVNGQLLVIRSRCTVTEGADGHPVRRHVLVCVPAGDPWRPARRPKPRIFGTQTAFVVGNKAGVDEIDVDEHGRVKVEFRWDRRDLHEGNPTRFVRVSQGWAGLDYGMVMLPRVNEEVIIAYLDGDPDEPVVVGRLHNAWSVSPLKLPAEKTRSIWKSKTSPGGEGFNQIMMEDKKGEELLELHAHRDNVVTVGANQGVDVGGDQKIHVAGKRQDHVEGAVEEDYDTSLTTTIGGKQETTAEAVVERYASQDTEMAGKKHTKAGAVDEDFKRLETTVEGLHKDKFGTQELEGGKVQWRVGALDWETKGLKWKLSEKAYIEAPSFVIDAPEFKVTNAGSHKEVKGVWETLAAAHKDTTAHKAAFLTSDTKSVYHEFKAFGTSVNAGEAKFDITGLKIDFAGFKLQNNAINLKDVGTKIAKNGIVSTIAGIFSIA